MTSERPTSGLTIALTGATGFIGRAVLKQLLRFGARVRAHAHRAELIPTDSSAHWQAGDIRDANTWDRLLPGADVLIHLASAGVSDLNNVADNVQTNLPAFVSSMQAAHRLGIRRVVLAGSCFEYGRLGEAIHDRGLRENDPLRPNNIYAATKACISMLAGSLSNQLGIETVILRPFHVFGPGEWPNRLVPSVIAMALDGEDIRTTDGRQIRDFVYLDDVADAFVAATVTPMTSSEDSNCSVFNLGSGIPTKLADVIRLVAQLCGAAPERLHLGAIAHRSHEMWRLVADPTRAREGLRWTPKVDLERGLRSLVAEARAARGKI